MNFLPPLRRATGGVVPIPEDDPFLAAARATVPPTGTTEDDPSLEATRAAALAVIVEVIDLTRAPASEMETRPAALRWPGVTDGAGCGPCLN